MAIKALHYSSLPHTVNCVTLFFGTVTFLCMKYLQNRRTDLRQIHRDDVFGPSLGRVWMSRSKVKVTRDKKMGFPADTSEIAELICAKFTRKTCLVPRSDEFKGQGQFQQPTW